MSIHHATLARASRFGLTIIEDGSEYVVRKGNRTVLKDANARDALQKAVEKLDLRPATNVADTPVEADGDTSEGQESPAARGSIVKDKYRVIYGDGDNCGDFFAKTLASILQTEDGLDLVALRKLGKENGIDVDDRWPLLNNGQKSMNLRNVLRGRMRRGEAVIVNGSQFAPN